MARKKVQKYKMKRGTLVPSAPVPTFVITIVIIKIEKVGQQVLFLLKSFLTMTARQRFGI